MVQIEINNEYLELPNDLKLSLKQRNELLYEETLPLTYSLPFKLFLTPKNCEILNYPQEWKNRALFTGEMECLVYLFENDNPRKSLLNFKSCSDTEVECYIQVGKDLGNITDLSLNEIDMGTMSISSSSFFDYKLLIFNWKYPVTKETAAKIKINGITFNFTIPNPSIIGSVSDTLDEAFLELTSRINNSDAGVNATYSLSGIGNESADLVLNSNIANQLINITDCKQVDGVGTLESDEGRWSWTFADENIPQIKNYVTNINSFLKTIHESYIAGINDFPCLFPIINNTRFVGEETTDFTLFQNFKLLDIIENEKILAFITPMPFLTYILKKCFMALGFYSNGTFFLNEAIKKLLLFSNVAAEQWIHIYGSLSTDYNISTSMYTVTYSKDFDINIHSSNFNISAHAPNMTIKEFLIAVRAVFNLKYTYDYKNMTVSVEFVKDLQGFYMNQAPDLTEYFVNSWSMQFQKAQDKNVSIKSFEFDIDSNDNQNSFLLPYQKKLIIDENGKKEIKPKIGTIGEEVIESCMMPSVKIDGVYNGGGEPVSQLKLLQVFGFRTDRNPAENNIKDQLYAMSQDRYAFFTRVSPLTISWQGDKGFYNQFWKNFTKLLVENKTLKIKTTFPPEQLSRMEENPFVFVNDSLLLFKEQDSEINANGTSTQNGTYVIV